MMSSQPGLLPQPNLCLRSLARVTNESSDRAALSWPCPSLAEALETTGPVPQLGSTVELSLWAGVQVSWREGVRVGELAPLSVARWHGEEEIPASHLTHRPPPPCPWSLATYRRWENLILGSQELTLLLLEGCSTWKTRLCTLLEELTLAAGVTGEASL